MASWMRLRRWSWCGRWSGDWRGRGRWRWCRSSQLYGNESGIAQSGVGKECRITGRIEFLDRIAVDVGHIEIATAVEGNTDSADGVGKERGISDRIEFLDRIVAVIGRVEIAAAIEGETVRIAQA